MRDVVGILSAKLALSWIYLFGKWTQPIWVDDDGMGNENTQMKLNET